VQLKATEDTPAVLNQLQQSCRSQKLSFTAVSWEELAEDYHKVVAMYSAVFNFMFWILFVICVLSIANTFLMSVFERTREIGTIRALGSSRGRVMLMFVLEGILLGLLGGVLGVGVGVLFAKLLSIQGIYMPPPPGYSQGYTIFINLLPGAMLQAVLLSVVCALLASLFAASRAARLQIVEALRYV
jgi:putative ABC transport system permease protein